MKRAYFFSILLASILLCSSCDGDGDCTSAEGDPTTQSFTLPAFQTLRLNILATLSVRHVPGMTNTNVVLEAQSDVIENIALLTDSIDLTVDFAQCVENHQDIRVFVETGDFLTLVVQGAGRIETDGIITAPLLQVFINGPGEADLLVDASTLLTSVNETGDVRLSGIARNHQVEINGTGDVNSFDMVTENTTVLMRSSGFARVTADSLLNVFKGGNGKVFYRGEPVIVQTGTGDTDIIDDNF